MDVDDPVLGNVRLRLYITLEMAASSSPWRQDAALLEEEDVRETLAMALPRLILKKTEGRRVKQRRSGRRPARRLEDSALKRNQGAVGAEDESGERVIVSCLVLEARRV